MSELAKRSKGRMLENDLTIHSHIKATRREAFWLLWNGSGEALFLNRRAKQ